MRVCFFTRGKARGVPDGEPTSSLKTELIFDHVWDFKKRSSLIQVIIMACGTYHRNQTKYKLNVNVTLLKNIMS